MVKSFIAAEGEIKKIKMTITSKTISKHRKRDLPQSQGSMEKGGSLKDLLNRKAIQTLGHNLQSVYPKFNAKNFEREAIKKLAPLSIMQRGNHIADVLRNFLPVRYEKAIEILLASLTPPLSQTKSNGLEVFFYLPHVCYVAKFGLDPQFNSGEDPFITSMKAQYEITKRFTAEFSLRHFLIKWPDRTLKTLMEWTSDGDPHVRRLCSEGTRPRLPWAIRIPQFVKDPRPAFPILNILKDDSELYVRRSVANHLGDIAKDHLPLALRTAEKWLKKDGMPAPKERLWVIRHALRYPARKGNLDAISLRKKAGNPKRLPN